MANLFLDLEAGSDAADGTTFANRVRTFNRACALTSAGDTVRIMGAPAPVALGAFADWKTGAHKVSLASAVNADIDTGEAAWTASANVTCATSTTRKEGATSASTAIGSVFSTGLAAYKALGGVTDYSSFEQISFWIQQTTGTLSANISVKLCSDAVGATPVDTLTLPAALTALNVWHPVIINKGSALGSNIQSVALYVDSDQGAQTFLIDNLIAVQSEATGALSHQHVLGKENSVGAGGTDAETWYPIRSIRGAVVEFDAAVSSAPGSTTNGRYFDSAENVAAYSQKLQFSTATATSNDSIWATSSGTSGSRIAISGGWNRTDMSTQTLQTWWTAWGSYVAQTGLELYSSFIDVTRLHVGRFGTNVQLRGTTLTCVSMQLIGGGTPGNILANSSTVSGMAVICCGGNIGVAGYGNTLSSLRVSPSDGLFGLTINGVGNVVALVAGSISHNSTPLGIGNTLQYGTDEPNGLLTNQVDATQINGSATAAANLGTLYAALEVGTAQAGGASTITLRAGASAVNDSLKDQAIFITGGTGAGQTNRITGYMGATKVATVGTAWVTQPTSSSVYTVLGRVG